VEEAGIEAKKESET